MTTIQNISDSILLVREPSLRFKATVRPGKFLPDNAPEKVIADLKAGVAAAKRKGRAPRWKITEPKAVIATVKPAKMAEE